MLHTVPVALSAVEKDMLLISRIIRLAYEAVSPKQGHCWQLSRNLEGLLLLSFGVVHFARKGKCIRSKVM